MKIKLQETNLLTPELIKLKEQRYIWNWRCFLHIRISLL